MNPPVNFPRTEISINALLAVKSKNLNYIKDASNTFKVLIDTGARISILKETTVKFS